MRQSLKIILSLLISLLLFGGFAVLALSGLFDLLQASFFQPRITREKEMGLSELAEAIARYHRNNIERFGAVLQEPYVANAFASSQQSQEDIFNRGNLFGKLLEEYQYLQGVRFLGPEGQKIHFSTFAGDVKAREKFSIAYYPLSEVDASVDSGFLMTPKGEEPRLVIDGKGGRFIYSFAVTDRSGIYRGSAIFYFSKTDLAGNLLKAPSLDFRELALVDRLGVLVNFPESERELIEPIVAEAWGNRSGQGISSETVLLETKAKTKEKYLLVTATSGRFGFASLLVPFSAFELQPLMKAVLLASFLLTVFLLVFLIFNLRQDPLVVISQRIKRFQLELLQEFIEGRDRVEWQRWRGELASGRAQLKSRIKKGAGRIPSGREAQLDGMIDRSWDEIISIIEARIGGPAKERVDIGYIEEIIQKALDRGQITVAAGIVARPIPQKIAPQREKVVVEEIGVEEVTELGAGQEVHEVEEAAEAEELEAAEEVEEAAAVEEAEELEELAGEEAAEVEALEEAEEVEKLAGEEAAEVPEIEAAEVAQQAEKPLLAAEAVEGEALEELQPVGEIVPLPPEPQEALEELPSAEAVPELRARQLEKSAVDELEELEELAEEEAAEAAAREEKAGEIEELQGAEAEETRAIQALLESEQELEVEEAAAPALLGPEEEDAQLQRLLGNGAIEAFSIAEVEAFIVEQRTSVVMEDGVYRIREEVLSGRSVAGKQAAPPANKGLKALAEAVLSTGPQAGGEETEEPGIGEILGVEFGVDLSTELQAPKEKERPLPVSDRQRAKRLQFYEDGLDYDHYLAQFRDGSSDTGKLKSLVEISRKIKAVSAAVFLKAGETYSAILKVGLLEKPEDILFSAGEPFYERFAQARKAVLINERLENIASLAKKFNPEDLKYIQGAIFLPAVFQGSASMLFLGLPSKKAVNIKEIITKLDIY